MKSVPDLFAAKVFNDRVMQERLSPDVYASLRQTVRQGRPLDLSVANAVAKAMCAWACERGATHYTHWFQPMTGITAEKHEGFITKGGGRVLMDFSGKELIRGESDASSFPSGGLRATFEARGYTVWDPTSYAFLKGKTLCIPTAFCSYGGEALDKKTPLLRSMEALNRQALRILRLFGHTDVRRVAPNVGAEQEYFLIDRQMYLKRRDLICCGRTLFGARPPKGQELNDHYYGAVKPRVQAFMDELNRELWEVGILAKTEHNEVAPSQHELACVYTTANVATDQNQLVMELMKKLARRHDLVCLLHEKPFDGVNGSGKHNNWSLSTDTGLNLLNPGTTPHENAQFLLFLTAVLQAVDDYQSLLRASVATAGNDCRLGGSEAPPAVLSIFLGDELTAVLDAIESDAPYAGNAAQKLKLGAVTLPQLPRDTTDRNRTSPFAFTGNKFEFRMVGSADSIACANIMLNSAVAESLRQYADRLEGAPDFDQAVHSLVREAYSAHKRIVFNGNGYDERWKQEACARGLLDLPTTADALPRMLDEKNEQMLGRLKVYSHAELSSRLASLTENYVRTVRIEALTMADMARQELIPAIAAHTDALARSLCDKKAALPSLACTYESRTLTRLSVLLDQAGEAVEALEAAVSELDSLRDSAAQSRFVRDVLLTRMAALRAPCDAAELLVPRSVWPVPTYGDLLFGV